MKTHLTLLLSLSVIALTGCSTFTPPESRPVVEDKVLEKFGSLATKADRRTVIFFGDTGKFIAEPSPDAMMVVASKLDATLKATVPGKVTDAQLKLLREFAQQVQRLSSRSQGVLFFRDASYRLCEAHLNQLIKEEDYVALFRQAMETSLKLITLELEKNATLSNVPTVTNSIPSSPSQ